jgi:uncharacterized membrane protein YfcA
MRHFAELASGAKLTAVTAAGTVASGVAQVIGLIPDDIGKLATLIGVVLSIVMIRYWRAENARKQAQHEIDMEFRLIDIESRKMELEENRKKQAIKATNISI